jgi:hypothetical protein
MQMASPPWLLHTGSGFPWLLRATGGGSKDSTSGRGAASPGARGHSHPQAAHSVPLLKIVGILRRKWRGRQAKVASWPRTARGDDAFGDSCSTSAKLERKTLVLYGSGAENSKRIVDYHGRHRHPALALTVIDCRFLTGLHNNAAVVAATFRHNGSIALG